LYHFSTKKVVQRHLAFLLFEKFRLNFVLQSKQKKLSHKKTKIIGDKRLSGEDEKELKVAQPSSESLIQFHFYFSIEILKL